MAGIMHPTSPGSRLEQHQRDVTRFVPRFSKETATRSPDRSRMRRVWQFTLPIAHNLGFKSIIVRLSCLYVRRIERTNIRNQRAIDTSMDINRVRR